jgi:hypothetical protein
MIGPEDPTKMETEASTPLRIHSLRKPTKSSARNINVVKRDRIKEAIAVLADEYQTCDDIREVCK